MRFEKLNVFKAELNNPLKLTTLNPAIRNRKQDEINYLESRQGKYNYWDHQMTRTVNSQMTRINQNKPNHFDLRAYYSKWV